MNRLFLALFLATSMPSLAGDFIFDFSGPKLTECNQCFETLREELGAIALSTEHLNHPDAFRRKLVSLKTTLEAKIPNPLNKLLAVEKLLGLFHGRNEDDSSNDDAQDDQN